MKTAYDVAQHAPPRAIPVYVVLPKPKEFIRGGTAALVNILCGSKVIWEKYYITCNYILKF